LDEDAQEAVVEGGREAEADDESSEVDEQGT
jgi:hypothetical protein